MYVAWEPALLQSPKCFVLNFYKLLVPQVEQINAGSRRYKLQTFPGIADSKDRQYFNIQSQEVKMASGS